MPPGPWGGRLLMPSSDASETRLKSGAFKQGAGNVVQAITTVSLKELSDDLLSCVNRPPATTLNVSVMFAVTRAKAASDSVLRW